MSPLPTYVYRYAEGSYDDAFIGVLGGGMVSTAGFYVTLYAVPPATKSREYYMWKVSLTICNIALG